MSTQEKAAERPGSDVKRAVSAAAIGNCTEWFDFGVYAYVSTEIGAAFFPGDSPAMQTLSAFGVFAISFVLRPLGSFFFGPLGDRLGRQRVLAITILLMSGSTFAIGLLPTFQQIGVIAPILLLAARMLQGFSTGGEYGGAATFIAEYAPDKRRGFFGSWLEFGTITGYALGASIPTALTFAFGSAAMHEWGWRVPFLIAGPLGGVGLYLRAKLEDTPAFKHLKHTEHTAKSPLRDLIVQHWRPLLILMGIVVLLNIGNYTLLTYMETYLAEVLQIDQTIALLSLVGVMLVMMLFVPAVGGLSDRVGRRPLLVSSCVSYLVLSVPAFALISMGTWLTTVGGLVMLVFCQIQIQATIPSALPALFPTKVRYGAFSIGYNLSTAAFGGTAPFILSALVTGTGNNSWPAYYLMIAAAIALVPCWLSPETARKPLLGEEPTGTGGVSRATSA